MTVRLPPPAALAASGALLLVAGAGILMGIITAEALYPGAYSTGESMISDLGATEPPDSVVLQPSAAIFDATMASSDGSPTRSSSGWWRSADTCAP